MKFTERTFITDTAPDVEGAVIIDTDEDRGYRIAEKWLRPEADGGPTWITYWISERALSDRRDDGYVNTDKSVTEEQFVGMLKLAGVYNEYADSITASA